MMIPRLRVLFVVGWISLMAGLGLVAFGGSQCEDARERDRRPAVFMVLGSCLVIGSLVFSLHIAGRIRAYNEANRVKLDDHS